MSAVRSTILARTWCESASVPTPQVCAERSEPRAGDDRPIETCAVHAAVVRGVAKDENGTLGGGDPIAPSVRRGENGRGRVETARLADRTAEFRRVAEGIDGSVGQEDPIASAVGSACAPRSRGTLCPR